MNILLALAAWSAVSVLVGILWGLFCRVGSGERREAGAIASVWMFGALAIAAAISLAGCVSTRRYYQARKEAFESCAAHLKKDHHGHYLSDDGELRIMAR